MLVNNNNLDSWIWISLDESHHGLVCPPTELMLKEQWLEEMTLNKINAEVNWKPRLRPSHSQNGTRQLGKLIDWGKIHIVSGESMMDAFATTCKYSSAQTKRRKCSACVSCVPLQPGSTEILRLCALDCIGENSN